MQGRPETKGEKPVRDFDTVLFDLDGTLTDSSAGITNTICMTLAHYGIEEQQSNLLRFIGPPLDECFSEYLPAEEVPQAIVRYRARYTTVGLFENEVYPGIPGMLQALKTAGLRLAVATSKPKNTSLDILEHFSLLPYFDAVEGATADGRVKSKQDVIELALAGLGGPDRARTVIVGDRLHDMEGAARCGISAIGVLWGFGSREELSAYRPVLLAQSPGQVTDFLLKE